MIKVEDISKELDGSVVIMAFAETKAEVPANVKTNRPHIKGLPDDVVISSNSYFHTADFDIGCVIEDGTVKWS